MNESKPGGITEITTARSMVADLLSGRGVPKAAELSPDGEVVTPVAPAAPAAPAAPVEQAAPAAPAAPVAPAAPAAPAAPVAPAAPAAPVDLRSRYSTTPPPAAPAAPGAPAVPEVPDTPPGVDATKPENKQQVFTWGKLRAERDQFHKEVTEARQQLTAIEEEKKKLAEEKALIEQERQNVIKERDTYAEKLGRVSLAESPEFQSRFDGKISELQTKLAQDLVKHSAVKEEEAMQVAYNLLTEDPAALAEQMKDNPLLLGRVMSRAEEVAALAQQRDEELKNWRQTSAALGIQTAKDQVIKSTESRRQWADVAIETAKQSGHPIFSAIDGEMKALADEVTQAAHGFVQTATEEELTRAAVEGFANPYLYAAINSVAEENRQLRARLEGTYRMSTPPVFPFGGVQAPPSEPPKPVEGVVPAAPSTSPMTLAKAAISNALQNLHRG